MNDTNMKIKLKPNLSSNWTGYEIFQQEIAHEVRSQNLSVTDLAKQTAKFWNAKSEQEKSIYKNKAKIYNKATFNEYKEDREDRQKVSKFLVERIQNDLISLSRACGSYGAAVIISPVDHEEPIYLGSGILKATINLSDETLTELLPMLSHEELPIERQEEIMEWRPKPIERTQSERNKCLRTNLNNLYENYLKKPTPGFPYKSYIKGECDFVLNNYPPPGVFFRSRDFKKDELTACEIAFNQGVSITHKRDLIVPGTFHADERNASYENINSTNSFNIEVANFQEMQNIPSTFQPNVNYFNDLPNGEYDDDSLGISKTDISDNTLSETFETNIINDIKHDLSWAQNSKIGNVSDARRALADLYTTKPEDAWETEEWLLQASSIPGITEYLDKEQIRTSLKTKKRKRGSTK